MVRVLRWGRYRVYIYREIGNRHHEPHCHIEWPDGRSTVDLNNLSLIVGTPIPKEFIPELQRRIEMLRETWETLNAEDGI